LRALVLNKQLHYDASLPVPEPHGDEVLLRIRKAGICRTDLELVGGYMNFSGILGHEFVGEVVSEADDLVGKRVVGEINVACGVCDLCQRGIPSQCRNRTTVGIDRHPGVFADYLSLTRRNLYVVPDNVSDDAAVFAEPLAAALQVTEAIHLSPRDRVVIIGTGKLGLLIAQVVRLTGADMIAVVRHESQSRLLDKWGIPTTALADLPPNRAQVVIDSTGTAQGFADSLNLVEPRGSIVLKSTYLGDPQVNMTRIAVDEIKIVGSRCGSFEAALRLLSAGLIDTNSLIEARYPLDDGLAAFEHASQKGTLKVLLDVS
jgi:threonine dehydrogenase-like Zn-dependent dehydrogenase